MYDKSAGLTAEDKNVILKIYSMVNKMTENNFAYFLKLSRAVFRDSVESPSLA